MPLAVDRRAIERARLGGAGLESLLASIWPEAYRIALSIVRDAGLAEDSAQEACAAIARSLAALDNVDVFPAWSYKIIVRHALTTVRRKMPTSSLEAASGSSKSFDRSDAIDLERALSALPPVQRAVVVLHYYAGLNSREIAAAARVPASTVRFYLMLARRTLRAALADEGSCRKPKPNEVYTDAG